MMIALAILLAVLGGFAYRARGGGVALGSTQAARVLFWGLPCGLMAYGLSHDPIVGGAIGLLAFASLLTGHAAHQALEIGHLGDGLPGHYQPRDGRWYESVTRHPLRWIFGGYDPYDRYRAKLRYHLTGLAIVGAVRGCAFLPLLMLDWKAALVPLVAAVAHPLAYWIGWQHKPGFNLPMVRGETEWAEFLFGVSVFGAVILAGI